MSNLSFELWLEFEVWQDEYDPEDEFFNMTISLSDGRRYALNVWTFKLLQRIPTLYQQSGEYLSGKYTLTPDLFIERAERKLVEQVVADLIENGDLREGWRVVDEADV